VSLQRSHTRSGRVQQMMQLLTICAISSMKADVKGCAALVRQKGNFGGLSPSIHWAYARAYALESDPEQFDRTYSSRSYSRQARPRTAIANSCFANSQMLARRPEASTNNRSDDTQFSETRPVLQDPSSDALFYTHEISDQAALQLIDKAFDPFTQRAGHMPGHMPSGVASATARNTTLRISASWR